LKAPLFSPVPSVLTWDRPDIPAHLKWTYVELYALTWMGGRHYRPYLAETIEELAVIIGQAEGVDLSVKGMEKRLYQLAEYGLTERRRVGQEWRTYLLLRADRQPANQSQPASHSQPQPASHSQPATASQPQPANQPDSYCQGESTPTPGRSQPSPTPTPGRSRFINLENGVGGVDLSGLDQHQHHLFKYLRLREVWPKVALDFAQRRIPLWEAVGWGEYAWQRREYLDNYAGVIVAHLGAGDPAPDAGLEWCPLCGNQWRRACTCGFMDALEEDG